MKVIPEFVDYRVLQYYLVCINRWWTRDFILLWLFCRGLHSGNRTKISFKLPYDFNILQAKISPFKRAVKWLLYLKIFAEDNIVNITDNSLVDIFSTSNLVHEFRASLNEMALHSNIALHWVIMLPMNLMRKLQT